MKHYRITRELFMKKKKYLNGFVFWWRQGDYIWCKSPFKTMIKFLKENHQPINE